jgi:hypothetical protein
MLWWLIDIWLASGLLIPIFWLLSLAGQYLPFRSSNINHVTERSAHGPTNKHAGPNRGRFRRLLLAAAASTAALALVFVGSFWDAMMRAYEPSPTIVAQVPELQELATRSSPFAGELASRELPYDGMIDTAGNKTDAQIQPSSETVTLSGLPEVSVASAQPRTTSRGNAASRAHTPIVAAKDRRRAKLHMVQTNRGTWLWPLNPNTGPNG